MEKIFLFFITLITIGCIRTETEPKSESKPLNTYEVLLATKDTIYIEAYYYTSYAGFWGNGPIEKITFYDRNHDLLQEINNPIYVKKIEKK